MSLRGNRGKTGYANGHNGHLIGRGRTRMTNKIYFKITLETKLQRNRKFVCISVDSAGLYTYILICHRIF